ncbi:MULTISPECIES: XRE family transcriptional regulator [Rhizorhabdus]|uniref:Phage repressor protein C, contains Cro/C1-type HTH and peptisase s24 domains n=2 Tax=Rhizorhabdus TaxID=1649486 RepID=A0A1T5BMW9_9SPHN|nr:MULTISPECIES: S24 family peptidase [Rhizorhabdus]ARR53464.1 hypothetical protein HY78_08525 [Rhizorhabdus wittichii DC-6]QTH19758.1 helix-turn-helix transcriptional regulator [Rhizorhabdus wittichii]SKB48631.1 Phage repressor protein C, contains Cro/C1-type HTH and peptisase s24 domains [Rhizorhabdus histidinilytica]
MAESIQVQRLKEAMAAAGFDQARLAKEAGCTQGAISQILLGKTQRSRYLADIASALGVSVQWLRGDSDYVGGPTPSASPARDGQSIALRHVDLSYSMGPGTNIDDYADESSFEFDAALLNRITRSPADRLFVASGGGDSMFPTIIDNDLVVIDTAQRILNMQDRIWAISLYGAGAIKRLRTVGPGRILVISDNKDVDNQEVSAEDIYLLGRVIWLGRRM